VAIFIGSLRGESLGRRGGERVK